MDGTWISKDYMDPEITSVIAIPTFKPIHFIHAQFASGCLRFTPAVSIHAKTIYLMHWNQA